MCHVCVATVGVYLWARDRPTRAHGGGGGGDERGGGARLHTTTPYSTRLRLLGSRREATRVSARLKVEKDGVSMPPPHKRRTHESRNSMSMRMWWQSMRKEGGNSDAQAMEEAEWERTKHMSVGAPNGQPVNFEYGANGSTHTHSLGKTWLSRICSGGVGLCRFWACR